MVYLEGCGHTFIKEDGKMVYTKWCSGGYTLQASKTATVIGHCPEVCQHGNLYKGVAVIVEYLESLGSYVKISLYS